MSAQGWVFVPECKCSYLRLLHATSQFANAGSINEYAREYTALSQPRVRVGASRWSRRIHSFTGYITGA